MFKNTRLSAVLAAVLFSVTAASALVSAPALADAPAPAAAEAPAAAPAADAAAAPAAPAADAAAPAADAAAGHGDAAGKEEVENPFGIKAVWHSGWVAKGTIVIMSIMSIGSWYIIITKLLDQMKIMRQAKDVHAKFWKASSVAAGATTLAEGSPFRFIAETGIKASGHHDGALLEQIDLSTWVTMSIQRAVDKVQSRLQDGLSFLATVGSTAPFIGLFGTVWGIYGALTNIGMTGNASIDKVAGPVGEALIMTAFGLAVAVPAVLGYNWLVRRNKSAMEEVRSFSADVHSVLISGAMSTADSAARAAKKVG
ncbi:MotA/TolQ/ExbB proton channel family protein [Pseudoduganella chitinolytica]|uniref:Biopolymer transport protein ExbB n=1 Tax=Pseudoduganella chitinolytica TaxID=34070 RepID=A0ABY8BFU4_9BURK|nr:MotA/TolQ/ExbB proton channel family protein [Pseudoduganella chitinolytica]WEF33159.1 MotA/TolQ/ExbB proton channel family protein [Pseudoduganella chitinolytica]